MTTVGEIGERELIARFTEAAIGRTSGTLPGDVVIGSGDDAAVFVSHGPVVVSTDTAVVGRHFRFDWSTPEQIGARAVVQSAADIAAMGGRLTGVIQARQQVSRLDYQWQAGKISHPRSPVWKEGRL